MRFDDLIRIEVGTGEETKVYNVHSNALTTRSVFFQRALSSSWKEAEERIVRLPEDDPDTFELYLHLVYIDEIACGPDTLDEEDLCSVQRVALAKLYVLCEKLQDTRAKNSILRALRHITFKCPYHEKWHIPGPEVVKIIYAGTVKGSPARRLLVDIYSYDVDPNKLRRQPMEGYLCDFLQELALNLMKTLPLKIRKSLHSVRRDGIDAYLEAEGKDKDGDEDESGS